jgi:hypothetical protein
MNRAIGAITIILAVACSKQDSGAAQRTASMVQAPAPLFGLNGVVQGDSAPKARAILGPPIKVEGPAYEESNGDFITTWTYRSLTLSIIEGKVEDMECTKQPCRSTAGITLGDSVSQIFTVYGEAESRPYKGGQLVQYENGKSDCGINFVLQTGRVVSMNVWCDKS